MRLTGGVKFTISYSGNDTDENLIDLYDVSQALVGFQRSLALTTHLILNDEIITQSPALKGARIYSYPAETGSWKMTTIVIATGAALFQIGTAQNTSPLGHLIYSLYDYVVSESLGVHVDLNKSLGTLYEEAQKKNQPIPKIRESQADSLLEKCSTAIREMHRPIYKNESAALGEISANFSGRNQPIHTTLTLDTYEFINETRTSEATEVFEGLVTSYNTNTYKGRIFIAEFGRPVSFELAQPIRTQNSARIITTSLRNTAMKALDARGSNVHILALRNTSRSGHLKSISILNISDMPLL